MGKPSRRKRKPDTGILPNGIREDLRDRIAKMDFGAVIDKKFDPATWTTEECKTNLFSGWRFNSLTPDRVELWVLGNLEDTITENQLKLNPNAFKDTYERVFKLKEVEIVDGPIQGN